jgi:hypothetical protein
MLTSSVLDLIEKLHAMTAFDTSGKEMDEGFFTFDFHHADILVYLTLDSKLCEQNYFKSGRMYVQN